MSADVTVRRALPTDAQSIAAAEREYIDCAWTEHQILDEIQSRDSVFLTAEHNGAFAGYLSGSVAADECEISNIAVLPQYRRRGVGVMLFGELFCELTRRGVKTVFLLVRVDNMPAVGLYEKLGFARVGVRPRYYKGQDAAIMRKIL